MLLREKDEKKVERKNSDVQAGREKGKRNN